MKKTVVSTKNFVAKHKTALAVTATAAICLTLNVRTSNVYNEFLKEHDLYDAFLNAGN